MRDQDTDQITGMVRRESAADPSPVDVKIRRPAQDYDRLLVEALGETLQRAAPQLSYVQEIGGRIIRVLMPETVVAEMDVDQLRIDYHATCASCSPTPLNQAEYREIWARRWAVEIVARAADKIRTDWDRMRADLPNESHARWLRRIRWPLFRLAWRALFSRDPSRILSDVERLLALRPAENAGPDAAPRANYRNVRRCVSCAATLTSREVIHSDGRCPRCGQKAGPGTIVKTTEHAERTR